MAVYFFWDIENVSFHNLDRITAMTDKSRNEILYVVYSKIKEARKIKLIEKGWILIQTSEISKNSADKKIQEMIALILDDKVNDIEKIYLITEDKGFSKISQKIIDNGIDLTVICGTKNPQWIQNLKKS